MIGPLGRHCSTISCVALFTTIYSSTMQLVANIGQKKTNTRHHLEAKLTCLLNDCSITSGLCTAEIITVNKYLFSLQTFIVARYLLIVQRC